MDIDPYYIREQYRKMTDEELFHFASNESDGLTPQSFVLLRDEFVRRDLDLAVMESAQVDRDLADALKLSALETSAANTFIGGIWEFVFEEKENGASDEEIFDGLRSKSITAEYAWMMIQSIEPRAKAAINKVTGEITVGRVLVIVGASLFLITLSNTIKGGGFMLFGASLIIGGSVRLYRSLHAKKKFETILENIREEKENKENLFQ